VKGEGINSKELMDDELLVYKLRLHTLWEMTKVWGEQHECCLTNSTWHKNSFAKRIN
jgi:hypothetical protein